MTNQTPVEYCRHENCRKPIEKCGHEQKHRNKCKGYIHVDEGFHYCHMDDNSDQVAEPADPPQQHTLVDAVILAQEPDGKNTLGYNYPLKAGTQMEERKPDAVINFVKDIIDRAENAHESKPGICVEIPVFMADIVRIKQALRTEVSESANREPQASDPNRDPLYKSERELQELRAGVCLQAGCGHLMRFHDNSADGTHGCVQCALSARREATYPQSIEGDSTPYNCFDQEKVEIAALHEKFRYHRVLIDCAAGWRTQQKFAREVWDIPLEPLVRFAAQFRHNCTDPNCPGGKIERENRQAVDKANEADSLRAFSLLQSECISAADSMYGACLSGDPDNPQVQAGLIRKFKTTFEAAAKHKLADEFLTISELKDEAASLRGLVGRMLEEITWEFYGAKFEECKFCKASIPPVKANMKHKPNCLISEAEAAIKEPHNDNQS